ncbi:carbon catabolite repressor protein [Thraustotheca clavata]|uniref:Carbon catabolite repressor protein n=1 Tax=Thraustotheca clavata TaxID=74557 RepID=A0A1V9ZBH2_9STRA|nr:carbon catabolite repressor protein [Thraustotheca clavata]
MSGARGMIKQEHLVGVDSPPRGSPTSGEGRISLRVDQPVEGCEVTTHAFYRSSEGDIDDDDFQLKFYWYKSTSKRACANKQCPRIGNGEGNIVLLMAKIECAVCLRMGIPNELAGFCTLECFRSGWGQHRQLHDKQDTVIVDNVLVAREQTLASLLEPMPTANIEVWTPLQAAKTYTPTAKDVGHVLRVECTAMFRSGEECGPPKFTETNIVLPFPPMAPKRQMISSIKEAGRVRFIGSFRVLSYNVLAEIYATRQMYPYCPMWALNWSFRKQLLKRELQNYNADILCLQEVQADHYKNYFQPMMSALGYDGLYQQKTREAMGLAGKVDGCATFYRKNRFYLKEQYTLEFNDAANEFIASLLANFDMMYPTASHQDRELYQSSLARVRQRLVRDNIAQILVLDVLPEASTPMTARKAVLPSICLTNVHICPNPEFPDVKLWQTNTLLQHMEQVANTRRLPIIICGDFNSEPTSAAYELLSQNHVQRDHPELKPLVEVAPITKFSHSIPFASAYATVFGSEPEYTNYTGNWVGVIDYIWFSSDKLIPVAGLKVHPPEVLKAYTKTCLPSCQFISDHVLDLLNKFFMYLSCRVLQKKILGIKRYWYESVKFEQISQYSAKKWKVMMYEPVWRHSLVQWYQNPKSILSSKRADVQLAPIVVGVFDNEKPARRALEAAIKRRDKSNPIATGNNPLEPLPIHWNQYYSVTIVSDLFQRKNLLERLELVYSSLLQLDDSTILTELCKVSYIGYHVRRLPCFSFIPYQLCVVCKSVAQHEAAVKAIALTDRLGISHNHILTIGVNTKAKTNRKDIHTLVEEIPVSTRVPHFYHGLPEELKLMMAAEQQAIFQEHQALGRDTDIHSVLKHVEKRKRQYTIAAIKLQRHFRTKLQTKVLRRILKRHRHAITIQRVYRGYLARVFTTELFLVYTFATTHIQATYRSFISRRATKALKAKMIIGAIGLQRIFRGHKARKWALWLRYHVANAIEIQRVIRGHFGRLRAQMFRHAHFKRLHVVPAVKLLQRFYRGYRGRCIYHKVLSDHIRNTIHTPAAITIQRVHRGGIGRLIFRTRTLQVEMARHLQHWYRDHLNRVKWDYIFYMRKLNRMASRIGAAGRGYLARQLYKREQRKERLQSVVIPAARVIQRVFRGYIVRKRLEEYRDRLEAATVIQYAWRKSKQKYKERIEYDTQIARMKDFNACTIQCMVRCFLARKHVLAKRLAQHGRYSFAAVKVQAAWRSFLSRKRLKQTRELVKLEIKARAMTTLKDELEMIHFDTMDASADKARLIKYKKKALQHIHDLKQMRIDWELRVPFLDKELAEMTPEDVERGWAEAFETEKVVIHFSRLLSAEEILSKKQQIREYEQEIESLSIELEDLERDHEEFLLNETLEIEKVRRFELDRALCLFVEDQKRAVRRQRARWKIRNVRRNVLLRRENEKLLEIIPLHEPDSCVSYQTATMRKIANQKALKAAVTSANMLHQNELENLGSRNPHVIATYDAIVKATKALVDQTSLGFRISKHDIREDGMCHTCGRVNCVCHLNNQQEGNPLVNITSAISTKKGKKAPPAKLGRRRKGFHDANILRIDPHQK